MKVTTDFGGTFPDLVAMDAKNEYITVTQARDDYGVLLAPNTFAILGFTEARQQTGQD